MNNATKDKTHYMSLVCDIEDIVDVLCDLECYPTPSRVSYTIYPTRDWELWVSAKWYDTDEQGYDYQREVEFPFRYLYEENWYAEELAKREKEKEEAERKREASKQFHEQQERELYEELKAKYETKG